MKPTIRSILEELCRKSYQAKPTESYYPLVEDAIAKIKQLLEENFKVFDGHEDREIRLMKECFNRGIESCLKK